MSPYIKPFAATLELPAISNSNHFPLDYYQLPQTPNITNYPQTIFYTIQSVQDIGVQRKEWALILEFLENSGNLNISLRGLESSFKIIFFLAASGKLLEF